MPIGARIPVKARRMYQPLQHWSPASRDAMENFAFNKKRLTAEPGGDSLVGKRLNGTGNAVEIVTPHPQNAAILAACTENRCFEPTFLASPTTSIWKKKGKKNPLQILAAQTASRLPWGWKGEKDSREWSYDWGGAKHT